MQEKYGIKNPFLEEAYKLHCLYPSADAHFDLPAELQIRYAKGERDIIETDYLPKWKKTGMRLLIVSIYIHNDDLPESGLRRALEQISLLLHELDALKKEIILIKSKREWETWKQEQSKIGLLLYLEGLDILYGRSETLITLYSLGVQGAALTWSRKNLLATGCCRAMEHVNIHGGISELGWATIKEMERLGMFIDISHLNDDGMLEILKSETKNVIATHSNARWIYNHYRNLTKEQVYLITERGGIIGINANRFLSGGSVDMVLKHIMAMSMVAGPQNVCLGLDLCDGYGSGEPEDCINGYSELIYLSAGLLQGGMPKEQVVGIMGNNLISYYDSFMHYS